MYSGLFASFVIELAKLLKNAWPQIILAYFVSNTQETDFQDQRLCTARTW